MGDVMLAVKSRAHQYVCGGKWRDAWVAHTLGWRWSGHCICKVKERKKERKKERMKEKKERKKEKEKERKKERRERTLRNQSFKLQRQAYSHVNNVSFRAYDNTNESKCFKDIFVCLHTSNFLLGCLLRNTGLCCGLRCHSQNFYKILWPKNIQC